jgi:hypothetical protein
VNTQSYLQDAKIDFSKKFVILEKVDGSLISPVYSRGKLILASKNGPTKFSEHIYNHFIKNLPPEQQYLDFFKYWLGEGYTPLFEWISPEDQVVLYYPQSTLVLIAIRHTITGKFSLNISDCFFLNRKIRCLSRNERKWNEIWSESSGNYRF